MVGFTVGHFKIERELGRGGMGVVYLATDVELKRPVALKFLGLETTLDPVMLERFQREAQAAAALNHPNIVTVYEFGEGGGQRYIAMEYAEGESLRARIAGGQIPVEEACRIARRVCSGLSAAHAEGIVHRDIKPENVILMNDGRVKILDFGIAKLRGAQPLTKGPAVGTAWYMSPEQLRGGDVDHRTDIWATGVVLYEMLTGLPPFRGEYESAVTYGIVNADPQPVRDLRPDIPAGVADAVARAMEKDPEKRFGRIADFAAALGPAPTGEAGPVPAPASRFPARLAWIGGAAIVVVAILVAVLTMIQKSAGRGPDFAGMRPEQVTYNGDVGDFDVSPDGMFLAFVAPAEGRRQALIVRDNSGGSVVPIDTALRISSPVWSPDGAMIAAGMIRGDSTAGVYVIPRLGGAARRVYHTYCPLLSWSIDGNQLALAAYGGYRVGMVGVASGDSISITIPEEVGAITAMNPRFTGKDIAVSALDREGTSIWKLSLAAEAPVRFIQEPSSSGWLLAGPQFLPSIERLFFLRNHTTSPAAILSSMAIGSGSVPDGSPAPVAGAPRQISGFRLTSDGGALVFRNDLSFSNLWLAVREGARWTTKKITEGTNWKSRGRFSPDGSKIVFTMADGSGFNLYMAGGPSAEGKTPAESGLQRLTSLNAACWSPAWSPDGSTVAFGSDQGNGFGLWTVAVDGGLPKKLTRAHVLPGLEPVRWAPSELILFPSQPHGEYMAIDPATGVVSPVPGSDSGMVLQQPVWSPDGVRLAGIRRSRETGIARLSVYENGAWKPLPMGEGSGLIGWTREGAQLLVLAPLTGTVSAVRVADGRTTAFASLPFTEPDPFMFDVSRDAAAFLYSQREPVCDLWMLRAQAAE